MDISQITAIGLVAYIKTLKSSPSKQMGSRSTFHIILSCDQLVWTGNFLIHTVASAR